MEHSFSYEWYFIDAHACETFEELLCFRLPTPSWQFARHADLVDSHRFADINCTRRDAHIRQESVP